MDWRIQVVGLNILENIPFGDRLHLKLQHRWGTLGDIDKENQLKNRIIPAIQEIKTYSDFEFEESMICEVGTGWYAMTPIVFYILGAKEIHTHDIVDWLTDGPVRDSLKTVSENLELLADSFDVTLEAMRQRLRSVDSTGSYSALLKDCNTFYHTSGVEIHEPPSHYDLFYSYSVLHRIPEDELHHLFERIVKFGKCDIVSHHVFEHMDILSFQDPNLNPYQFLTYSDRIYNMIQTKYSFQNRLRHSDFIDIFQEYGFEPLYVKLQKDDSDYLTGLDLNDRFARKPNSDLITRRSRVLAKRDVNDVDPIYEVTAYNNA